MLLQKAANRVMYARCTSKPGKGEAFRLAPSSLTHFAGENGASSAALPAPSQRSALMHSLQLRHAADPNTLLTTAVSPLLAISTPPDTLRRAQQQLRVPSHRHGHRGGIWAPLPPVRPRAETGTCPLMRGDAQVEVWMACWGPQQTCRWGVAERPPRPNAVFCTVKVASRSSFLRSAALASYAQQFVDQLCFADGLPRHILAMQLPEVDAPHRSCWHEMTVAEA